MFNAPAAPIARIIASTRASQSAWNIGSFGSGSTVPKPSMPPMSCTPFMTALRGCFGKPVPIIESRVTSSASCSSLQPSVPSGRIGSTRSAISAVESHTRISVPSRQARRRNRRSTPRGSFTARER